MFTTQDKATIFHKGHREVTPGNRLPQQRVWEADFLVSVDTESPEFPWEDVMDLFE